MSKYIERARERRDDPLVHYNCAQAVLIPFAEDAGLTDELAFSISSNFGSGMKMGSVCGAITGGLMVLGLFGLNSQGVINRYYKALRANHSGCLDCADLLRMNSEAGRGRKPHCDDMVYECVSLAESLLREQGRLE